MRARQDLVPVGIPTYQIGGNSEPLQILRRKRALPVGGRQLVEGIRPRPPLEGGPAPIQCVSRGHARSPPARGGPPRGHPRSARPAHLGTLPPPTGQQEAP